MTKLEKIRSPLLWILGPLVVGFAVSFLLPQTNPTLKYIARLEFLLPLMMFLTWMVAGFVKRFTTWSAISYRFLAATTLSWLFYSILPTDWPWWLSLIPGIVLTTGLSIGADLLFHRRAAATTIQTRSVPDSAAPQGRQDQIAVGLNMRAPNGEAAFVDAGTTVANMGLQAQANMLAASNEGRKINAEERKLELEHLDKVIHDPEADELSKRLARIRYNQLLNIKLPEEQSSTPPKTQVKTTWETAPYMRGRGVRK